MTLIANFVGKGTIKSRNLKTLKYQYLSKFLKYGPEFLHEIIDLIGFKQKICKKVSHGTPSLISRGGLK